MLTQTQIPLSLYIHLPWCVRKCPYCDFNSHTLRDNLPEELYINALLADFREQLPFVQNRRFVSVFFGGGTPSLFSPQGIARILDEINALSPFTENVEITLEANPGTLDESRFRGFKQAGVNRVSLGIQSLQDDKLKVLGRIHDRNAALRAVTNLQKAGFRNFNLDLMHGLPNQSVADAVQDLQDALAFAPTHLSWYQLTIEPNTLYHHQPPKLPAEDELWDIQEAGKAILHNQGYGQYEVSAYAREQQVCQHNMNYWQFGDYLGIGAGAHSKLTNTTENRIVRHWQVKNPKDYLNPAIAFTAEQKDIVGSERVFELMLNALRLTTGIPITQALERTGLDWDAFKPAVELAQKKKLLVDNQNILLPTELGQQFLNDLVSLFLPKPC